MGIPVYRGLRQRPGVVPRSIALSARESECPQFWQGLERAFIPVSGGFFEIVEQKFYDVGGNGVITEKGRGFSPGSVSSPDIFTGMETVSILTTFNITASPAGNENIVARCDTNNTGWALFVDNNDIPNSETNTIVFRSRLTNFPRFDTSGGTNSASLGWHSVLAVHDARVSLSWLFDRGHLIGNRMTDTETFGESGSLVPDFQIGTTVDGFLNSTPFSGQIGIVAFYSTRWLKDDCARLTLDPYAPFRRKPRLYVIQGGAGGTTVTLNPDALSSASAIADAALSASASLAPASLASQTVMVDGGLSASAVLQPAPLASATVMQGAVLSASARLSPAALSSTTRVSDGSVSQTVSLAADAMTSSTAVKDTAITIGTNPAVVLNPDSFASASAVQDTAVTQDVSLTPASMSSNTRTADANIRQTCKLTPVGATSSTVVNDAEIFASAFIDAIALLSPSAVSDAAIIQQVMLDAESLTSTSHVTDASIYSNIPMIDPSAITVESKTPGYGVISKSSIFTVRSKTP